MSQTRIIITDKKLQQQFQLSVNKITFFINICYTMKEKVKGYYQHWMFVSLKSCWESENDLFLMESDAGDWCWR